MKKILVVGMLIFISSFKIFACDKSEITNQQVVVTHDSDNSLYSVEFNLCIGGGTQGSTSWADADTHNILIGFEGPQGIQIAPLNLDPNSYFTSIQNTKTAPATEHIAHVYTANELSSFNSAHPSENLSAALAYEAPVNGPSSGKHFACKTHPTATATPTCLPRSGATAPLYQLCFPIKTTLNDVPTKITVYGVEGAGDFMGGCTGRTDLIAEGLTVKNAEAQEVQTPVSKAFPNPFLENFRVVLNPSAGPYRIELFNLAGHSVQTFSDVSGGIFNHWFTNLRSGSYQLIVTDKDQNTFAQKLWKM